MNENQAADSGPPQASDLRREAERRWCVKQAAPAAGMAEVDSLALLYELEVHQIELEMQYEEVQLGRAAAEEASEKYQDLFDFAPVGYFLWDHRGRILEVNLAGAALLDLDRNAVIQKRFGQFVAIEHRARFAEFCARVVAAETKQTCEIKLLKNGQAVDVLVEGIAARDRQGQRGVCRAAVIDVSSQKRADELAAANQALEAEIASRRRAEVETQRLHDVVAQEKDRLSALLDSITDEIWFADTEGTFTLTNPSANREFNLGNADAINIRQLAASLKICRPDGTPRPIEEAPPLRALRGEVVRNLEETVRNPATGELRHRQVSSSPVRDAGGNIIGSVSVVRDITDHKRAEEEIRGLAEFPEEAPSPVVRASSHGAVPYTNPAAARLLKAMGWQAGHPLPAELLRPVRNVLEDRGQREFDLLCAAGRTFSFTIVPSSRAGQVNLYAHDITDRKHAEAERQKFVSLADQSTEFVGLCDLEHRPYYVNEAGWRLVGLESLEQACRTPILELFFPEDRRFITEEFFPRVLREGRAEAEIRFRHFKTGAAIWMIYNVFYIRDESGQAVALATVSRNITARKRAEEALRESETRFRKVFDHAATGIKITDCAGRFVQCNAAYCQLTGYSQAELAAMEFSAPIHPEDREHNLDVIRQLLNGELPSFEIENRYIRGDGSVVWVHKYVSLLRDDRDRPTHIVVLVTDMTERKQTEDVFRFLGQCGRSGSSEGFFPELARYLALTLDMDIACIDRLEEGLLSAQTLAVYHNGRFEDNLSYALRDTPCGDAVGQRICCFPRDVRGLFPRDAVLQDLQAESYVGTTLWSSQGKPIGLIAVIGRQPLADTRVAESILQLVAVRGAGELERQQAEEGLAAAKVAAEAANVAKSQFLANMSHELRTPMNAILGMIDVALPKTTDPLVRDCLQTAKGSADLLLMLLNDLLDSAKIESGKMELDSAPFSLRRLLDQIAQVLSVRASEKGLACYCRLPEEMPETVKGDRSRLQQVLFNLVGNAIKFTERGEVEIRVRASPLPDEEGDVMLEFTVRDTGIGIPPASLELIFQPFAQADASMARRFGGTGLGLSICKSLVELMGGCIWVESEVGKGSTFSFTVRLPLAKELPPVFAAPVTVPTVASGPLRILLVEDNPANQKFATYVLQDRGHLVAIAGDGREAVSLAGQHRYDVILMDVQMPGMNGLEATAAIREAEQGTGPIHRTGPEGASHKRDPSPVPPRVPIIAMTAHAMQGDRDRCLAAGMDGYLSKPIDVRELIALVESLAARAQSAAAAPAAAKPPAGTIFDPVLALQRCANKPSLLADMIECFVADADSLLPQMRAALAQGDLAEMGQLGHRLKGTLVYLGAEPAGEAALRVERFGTSSGGTRSEAEAAVNALEHACLDLQAALREHSLAAGPKPGD